MINPAVFTTTFLAAAVEIIEMVIIVVGVSPHPRVTARQPVLTPDYPAHGDESCC